MLLLDSALRRDGILYSEVAVRRWRRPILHAGMCYRGSNGGGDAKVAEVAERGVTAIKCGGVGLVVAESDSGTSREATRGGWEVSHGLWGCVSFCGSHADVVYLHHVGAKI